MERPMSQRRAEAVMQTYLTQVLSNRKYERIAEFAADNMVDHTQPERGPAALEAHARRFCDNITDLEITVERIFATDDTAVGIWRWSGTPIQSWGVSASGEAIYPRIIASIFRLEDDMVVDYQVFVDAVDVATQL